MRKRYTAWECPSGDCKIDGLCGCGLRVGDLQLRQGILCSIDDSGRLYLRAPRAADVALAQRVVASIADTPLGETLLPEITGIGPKP